ncbi:hypothetical protein [Pseudomonas knackmussii]|uniref:hypothetical protein n=1 Tax=Pseudomonas knackmussii TaxID=65741 RepID=UPI0013624DC4|nr:hypothetical protein [Pseudomonas knackmussii]
MIDEFKADLLRLNSTQMYRKYILGGGSRVLTDDLYYQLRQDVCEGLRVEFNDVVLVGSGRLGFSLNPKQRYREFCDDSDIDLAIVSTPLFERVWKEAYLYKRSGADWPKSGEFFRYLSNGWVRPDMMPSSRYFELSKRWWNFFNELTRSQKYGAYKVRGGLYHSHFFLENYQIVCIEQCVGEFR